MQKKKITIWIYLFTYITATFISIPGFYAFLKSEYVFNTLYWCKYIFCDAAKEWALVLVALEVKPWSLLLSGTGDEELRSGMEMFIVTMLGY